MALPFFWTKFRLGRRDKPRCLFFDQSVGLLGTEGAPNSYELQHFDMV